MASAHLNEDVYVKCLWYVVAKVSLLTGLIHEQHYITAYFSSIYTKLRKHWVIVSARGLWINIFPHLLAREFHHLDFSGPSLSHVARIALEQMWRNCNFFHTPESLISREDECVFKTNKRFIRFAEEGDDCKFPLHSSQKQVVHTSESSVVVP